MTVIECPDGLANVETRRGVTQVFVADLPVAGMDDPNRFAAAACTPEGDALVVARQAPLPLRHAGRSAGDAGESRSGRVCCTCGTATGS